MKYKIIDGSTFTLAGVASYTTFHPIFDTKECKKPNIDFNFNDYIHIDKEKIKEEAKRFKEEAKAFKNQTKETVNQAAPIDFDKMMESFGKSMEQFGKSFEKGFSAWGKSFEEGMENFGVDMNNFEEHMEKFGKDFSRGMENLGEVIDKYATNFEKHWDSNYSASDYIDWELESLFNELYDNSDYIKNIDATPKYFYQVEGYELGTELNDQLTFVGCRTNTKKKIPYNFVTHQLKADKWLVIKLNQDEFEKDWLNKVSELNEIKDYDLPGYFIIRHLKDKELQENKKVKLYVPLKKL